MLGNLCTAFFKCFCLSTNLIKLLIRSLMATHSFDSGMLEPRNIWNKQSRKHWMRNTIQKFLFLLFLFSASSSFSFSPKHSLLTLCSSAAIILYFIHWMIVLHFTSSAALLLRNIYLKKRCILYWISCHNIIIKSDSLELLHSASDWMNGWLTLGETTVKMSVFFSGIQPSRVCLCVSIPFWLQ